VDSNIGRKKAATGQIAGFIIHGLGVGIKFRTVRLYGIGRVLMMGKVETIYASSAIACGGEAGPSI
jgi:hypothetical protein